MSIIDAYACRLDSSKWKHSKLYDQNELDKMKSNRFQVCAKRKFVNKIDFRMDKVVTNFYPSPSSNPHGPAFLEFCIFFDEVQTMNRRTVRFLGCVG